MQALTRATWAFVFFLGLSGPGAAAVIDFDDGIEGDLTGSEIFGGLLTLDGNGDTLALFNSNCNGNGSTEFGVACTGGDPDLASGSAFGTAPQGLVLIIEENPGDGVPDDDARGGDITFDFLGAMRLVSMSFLDLDRNFSDLIFDVVQADGTTLFDAVPSAVTLLSSVEGDNSLRRFDFGIGNVTSLQFSTSDSGAVAGLVIEPDLTVPPPDLDLISMPIPAGLPLLLTGIGALLWARRRSSMG
ncbi:MAG: VPLPA-CTERM sorting domain-containing protein [Pseudomonadota bacterium]